VGCAGGIERLVLLQQLVAGQSAVGEGQEKPAVFAGATVLVAACDAAVVLAGSALACELRAAGVPCVFDPVAASKQSVARQLGDLAKGGGRVGVLVGPDELRAGTALVVNMQTRARLPVLRNELAHHIQTMLQ
jgi:histidyl-tRNA synthetase